MNICNVLYLVYSLCNIYVFYMYTGIYIYIYVNTGKRTRPDAPGISYMGIHCIYACRVCNRENDRFVAVRFQSFNLSISHIYLFISVYLSIFLSLFVFINSINYFLYVYIGVGWVSVFSRRTLDTFREIWVVLKRTVLRFLAVDRKISTSCLL